MPTTSTLALFSLAAIALAVVPGPAVAYIVTQSVDKGRRAGIVSALGIASGGLVHVAAATIGLSALIASSAAAFTVVKLVGAVYLIAVGVRRLLRRDQPEAEVEGEEARLRRLYAQGVVVNVLNPKTALFFLAFLPQFVDRDRSVVPQVAILGLLFAAIALLSDLAYAVLADALAAVCDEVDARRAFGASPPAASSSHSASPPLQRTELGRGALPRIPLLSDARIVIADRASPTSSFARHPRARRSKTSPRQSPRALEFPLAGEPLASLVRRGGTATVVIEQPSLPIPAAALGPVHVAIAAVVDELGRLGVAKVTILVAGGLLRRTSPREIGLLVPPEFRRRFKGRVIVHDAEADDLVELGRAGNVSLRVNPALVETDLVVTVTAAETVLHGGPAALLAATGRDSLRAAGALSLLETSASQGWRLAVETERLLAARVAVTGVSLVLNTPRIAGPFTGYPQDQDAIERILDSRLRRLFQVAPGRVRQRILERLPRELTAAAAYGGTPSVAHAEALLRGTVFRGAELAEPVDALVIGIPPTTPFMPRERPNPISAAYLGLGLALRLWRNASPINARRHRDSRPPVRAPVRPRPLRIRIGFSSTTSAVHVISARCAPPSRPQSRTRVRSPTTALDMHAIPYNRSSSGARATPPRIGSARC